MFGVQVVACVGCTRWLLLPWLVMYMVNIFLLICLGIGMIIIPVPLIHENLQHSLAYQALRCVGFIPLTIAAGVGYGWLVVR